MKTSKWQSISVIKKFAFGGLCLAIVYSISVTLQRVFLGPEFLTRMGLSWGSLIALYFVALPVGGILAGLLYRFLWRSLLGAAVLGAIGALPLYLGASLLVAHGSSMWSSIVTGGTVLGTVVVGGGVGMVLWSDDVKERASHEE